jgi:hypothetical protein
MDGVLVFPAIEACSCAMLEIGRRAVAVTAAAADRDRALS